MNVALGLLALGWPAALLLVLSAMQDRFPGFARLLDRLFP